MKEIRIKFKENGKIYFDNAIIGEDITEEQAQKLVELGMGRIVEIAQDNTRVT